MSQELVLDKVRFRNFQSFGNNWSEIDLNVRGTTLVVGENLDQGGSSGAGKTTAMSIVSYCLFDKIPTGVSKDKMINRTNDKKITSMEAELYFHIDKDHWKIYRSRGAHTAVQIFHNGADVTPASVSHVNTKIEEIIGFSYNLFSQIVLFNGNSRAFLDLPVSEQRALIEELFKITLLSRKAAALKKEASETGKAIDRMKVLIKQQEAQNEGFQKRVREADERAARWYVNHAEEIKKINDTISSLENIDFETEEQLHQRIVEVESVKMQLIAEVKRLRDQKINLQKERSPHETELALSRSTFSKKAADLVKVREDLVHLRDAKCPYCLQNYEEALDKAVGLEEAERVLVNEIDDLSVNVDKLKLDVDMFTSNRDSDIIETSRLIDENQALVDKADEEIAELQSVLSYKTLKDHISAQSTISVLYEKLAFLQTEENPHLEAIQALISEGEVKVDYEALDELVEFEAHQKFLVKLLTDKNSYVRKNLIATTTPFLNKRIGYYTEKLNLPHVVLFQPDMSCEITELGRELDHGNLSNGEKKKLNISICLAFRDVLTYLHSKVNVLFTDEVDGGSISGNDVDCLISLLKHKAWDDDISIFIISHRPEFEGRCDRNLVVRKEQGFSSLILQPEE